MVDYIVFGMKTNTEGRTAFGSFDNESLTGYYLFNFDLVVSAAINPSRPYAVNAHVASFIPPHQ